MRLATAIGASLVLLLGLGGAQAAGNLLQNGNAEAGAGAKGTETVPVPAWSVTGAFTAVEYGSPGSPVAAGGPPDAGRNFFAGGSGPFVSTATQTADVSANAAAIDAGQLDARLSAWLGGFSTQEDSAEVEVTFLGADGNERGSGFVVGPVSAGDRGGQTKLLPQSDHASVPVGTRSIQVRIVSRKSAGIYNDGYADDVTLTLSQGAAPSRVYVWRVTVNGRPATGRLPKGATYTTVTGSGTATFQPVGSSLRPVKAVGRISIADLFPGPPRHHRTIRLDVSAPRSILAGARSTIMVLAIEVTRSDYPDCRAGRRGTATLTETGPNSRDVFAFKLCGVTRVYITGAGGGTLGAVVGVKIARRS